MKDIYHADRECPAPSLSSSVGKILLNQSPRHAWIAHPRLNPEYRETVSAQFDLGTAAHALLLEGEDSIGEVNADDWRTKQAKEDRDAIREAGRIPLLSKHASDVRRMAQEARNAWNRCEDMDSYRQANGVAEKPIYWQDAETGIWCRAKPDWLAHDRKLIVDYKSTAVSANPHGAGRLIERMGYDVQAGAYIDAVRSLYAFDGVIEATKFVFLFQEIEAPYACSWVGLDPAYIEMGMEKWSRAKAMWAECLSSGHWPAYPDRICWVEPEPYAVAGWQQRSYESETPVPDAKWLGA